MRNRGLFTQHEHFLGLLAKMVSLLFRLVWVNYLLTKNSFAYLMTSTQTKNTSIWLAHLPLDFLQVSHFSYIFCCTMVEWHKNTVKWFLRKKKDESKTTKWIVLWMQSSASSSSSNVKSSSIDTKFLIRILFPNSE